MTDQTKCFTYEVKMIVQVLDNDEKTARESLDKNGGYVSSRVVKLLDAVPLLSGSENEDN